LGMQEARGQEHIRRASGIQSVVWAVDSSPTIIHAWVVGVVGDDDRVGCVGDADTCVSASTEPTVPPVTTGDDAIDVDWGVASGGNVDAVLTVAIGGAARHQHSARALTSSPISLDLVAVSLGPLCTAADQSAVGHVGENIVGLSCPDGDDIHHGGVSVVDQVDSYSDRVVH